MRKASVESHIWEDILRIKTQRTDYLGSSWPFPMTQPTQSQKSPGGKLQDWLRRCMFADVSVVAYLLVRRTRFIQYRPGFTYKVETADRKM